jgi:hypothetical protein
MNRKNSKYITQPLTTKNVRAILRWIQSYDRELQHHGLPGAFWKQKILSLKNAVAFYNAGVVVVD